MVETKISSSFWQKRLAATWKRLQKTEPAGRLAILGVGQELRGDDAAGVEVVRLLQERLTTSERLQVILAGPAPENFTGVLRRLQPTVILIVDVGEMGLPSGSIRWLELAETQGVSFSTHTLPPYLYGGYFASELSCQVALLCIQPEAMGVGSSLSRSVQRAVEKIAAEIMKIADPSSNQ
ncbi:MAG: hydrogenase 3 maturation endopeptidase HyCI [Chloroflexi bacterium]|nr:hydrogenase 3 maturation endopeptidase HyCI [Chloroflexota bacterium]